MKRKLKLILGPLILLLTLVAFSWYLGHNPQVISQLKQTSALAIVALVAVYIAILAILAVILHISMNLYKKHMSLQDNFLLTAYTSLVNFFGPGQSGPGFRGVYLKVRHGLLIKQYIFTTLVYYAFYAIFSGLLLFVGSRPWWQTLLLMAGVALASFVVIRIFLAKNKSLVKSGIDKTSLVKFAIGLGVMTLLQVICTIVVYYVELHSLDSSVSLSQAITYTGAANFALFVAITPGAIGIREAFLVFSQRLHHIPNDLIVAANVLDRAVYVLFLGIVFIFVLALHAGNKLQVKKVQQEFAQDSEQ